MNAEHCGRWEAEIRRLGGRLKSPRDLLVRAASSDDFVDSAEIGGVSVADIVKGRIAESQIPKSVIDAFHAQYPQLSESFVGAVNRLSGDPARLQGLVNGVKGKLLEMDYCAWLNSGHLPVGYTAELAHRANNPKWDIVIHDSNGHVSEQLQVKATASLDYVRQAAEAHPDIDVVVPHELYEKIASHPELLDHFVDSHEQFAGLGEQMADATSAAEAAGIHFHIPMLAIAFAVGQNFLRYRQGRVTLQQALRDTSDRSLLAIFATGTGWAAASLAHSSVFGIPVAFAARLAGGQFLHNRKRREILDGSLNCVVESLRALATQALKPVLELPDIAN
jgi:hypothetical protein